MLLLLVALFMPFKSFAGLLWSPVYQIVVLADVRGREPIYSY